MTYIRHLCWENSLEFNLYVYSYCHFMNGWILHAAYLMALMSPDLSTTRTILKGDLRRSEGTEGERVRSSTRLLSTARRGDRASWCSNKRKKS